MLVGSLDNRRFGLRAVSICLWVQGTSESIVEAYWTGSPVGNGRPYPRVAIGRGAPVAFGPKKLPCRKPSQTVASVSERLRHLGEEWDRWGCRVRGAGYGVRGTGGSWFDRAHHERVPTGLTILVVDSAVVWCIVALLVLCRLAKNKRTAHGVYP